MFGWVCTGPFVIMLLVFGILPVLFAVRSALIVTPVFGAPYWSVADNFVAVVRDPRLLPAVGRVCLLLLVWVPLLLILVFGAALVMDAKRTRMGALTRFVAYVPGAVTGAAAAFLWLFMFSPTVSPIGGLIRLFTRDQIILSDTSLIWILAIMGIAIGGGGWMLVVYGALVSLPREVMEAALIDGAGSWQTALFVKLPMIRSHAIFILIMTVAGGFQIFAEPAVMAKGAPTKVSSTWSVNQLVANYVTNDANFGKASALALMVLATSVLIAYVIIRTTRFYTPEQR